MSTLEVIQTFFQYNASLNDRIRQSLLSLNEDQFLQDVPYSHGSLRNQVVHLANSTRMWLSGFLEQPRPERLQPADFPTRELAFQIWQEAEGQLMAHVMSLTEADMHGQAKRFMGPNWQAYLHLANHNTDHRSQILRILHDFGAPTFDQDMVFYIWDWPGKVKP